MSDRFTKFQGVIDGRKATTATKRKVEVDHTPPRQIRPALDLGNSQRWVVAMHEPNREARAMGGLVEVGYPAFMPMITRWRRKGFKQTKAAYPLFPGYIFVALVSGPNKAIKNCECISKVVSDHLGPLYIGADKVRALSDAMMAGAFDETITPEDRFKIGESVDIEAGPFLSISGKISRLLDHERVSVLLEMFGAMREVTVEAHNLRRSA